MNGALIFERLSRRAQQVLALLVTGYTTNKDIAAALGVSESTVHAAMAVAMDATGMGNRVELALFVDRDAELKLSLMKGMKVPQ